MVYLLPYNKKIGGPEALLSIARRGIPPFHQLPDSYFREMDDFYHNKSGKD